MTDILDNINVIAQKDPEGALGVAAKQFQQASYDAKVINGKIDHRAVTSIVVSGMGGSALAALLAKVLLQADIQVPFEIVREYDLPSYVNENTLVIASSYSGNTEETLSSLDQARQKQALIAVIASGGKLIDIATEHTLTHVTIPSGIQPRMAVLYNLRALFALLEQYGVINSKWLNEMKALSRWLENESKHWGPEVPARHNIAKKIALEAVGKTPVFYGSPLTAPLAYKWKISWNENAKNVAFWNQYPEFNHNEFMGWASHPVEKPFAIYDVRSSFDKARVTQRMELSDRLLSGKRPHASEIELKGGSLFAQLLWGSILADFASIYTAILNGIDPTPVVLIEKLKQELADNPK